MRSRQLIDRSTPNRVLGYLELGGRSALRGRRRQGLDVMAAAAGFAGYRRTRTVLLLDIGVGYRMVGPGRLIAAPRSVISRW